MLPLCADLGRRRDPVEPAGPRPADPGLGRHDGAQRDRRVRQDALRATTTAAIVDAVARIAERRGVSRGPGRAGLGARATRRSTRRSSAPPSRSHIDDAVASLDVELTDDEVAELEAPYTPRPIAGFA